MAFWDKRYDVTVHTDDLPSRSDSTMHLGKVAEGSHDVHMDVDQLCKHTIIAGITGGGKTVAGNVIIEEAIAHGASVIIIDPTIQWTGIIKENTDEALRSRFDIFRMRLADAKSVPADIIKLKDGEDFRRATRMPELIKPGIATVVLVNELSPAELDRYVCELIQNVRAARLPQSKQLRLLLAFDEIHVILPKFGGNGTGFVELERASREFREFGVGLLLLSQVLEDFLGNIRANINTEVQMRTTYDDDLAKARLKYGHRVADSIMRAQTGTGLFHNADYNLGSPFFVAFRPPYHNPNRLSEKELKEYFELSAMIAALEGKELGDSKPLYDRAVESLRTGSLLTARHCLESIEGK